MVSLVHSNTSALLSLALDAAGMRQQAIAQNIANINTPGYQRMSVSFERRLAELADTAGLQAPTLSSLADYRPTFNYGPAGADGASGVEIDTEMAQMSENTLRHQTLLKALNKHYALLDLAINEGKR